MNRAGTERSFSYTALTGGANGADERGAVIFLVGLLLVLLMTFAVLAIDIAQYASSREQSQHYSRLAVLAALERFYASTQPTTPLKLAEALVRAKEVSNLNLMISDPEQRHDVNFTQLVPEDGSSHPEAILTPGNWFYEDDGTDPCAGKYPCFRAIPAASILANTRITAFRVTGSLYQGISTRLARGILGVDTMPVFVFATAAVTPRHGCFMVDLTGSITAETHKGALWDTQQDPDPLTYGRGATASYILHSENANEPANPTLETMWSNFNATQYNRPASDAAWNAFLAAKYPSGFPTGGPVPTISSLNPYQYSLLHFGSDYRAKVLLGDRDYGAQYDQLHPDPSTNNNYKVYTGSNSRKLAHIDIYRDVVGADSGRLKYAGPEPLQTVLTGLNAAMIAFKNRQVAGDEACLIFYSKRLPWPGVVKLTNNFDYLINLTDSAPQAGILNNETLATDPKGAASGLAKLIRHGIIPGGADAQATNTPLALIEASNQLKGGNINGSYSSDFVVSISDGMTNCDNSGGSPVCNDAPAEHNASVTALQTIAQSSFKAKNIPIHWIMVGNNVGPHTIKYKATASGRGTPGPCLSDDQARNDNVPLVRGGWNGGTFNTTPVIWTPTGGVSEATAYYGMSPTNPFYQANLAPYDITAKTRGLWGPIRPRNPSCGAGKKDTPDDCTYDVGDTQALTDSAAIQNYDPYCRTPAEQMTDYMDRIIGDNPFTLVEAQ